MVGGVLHPHHPFAIDDDAVPVVVGVHLSAQEPSPEPALSVKVGCVDDKHLTNDPHSSHGSSVTGGPPVTGQLTGQAPQEERTISSVGLRMAAGGRSGRAMRSVSRRTASLAWRGTD